MRTVKTSRVDGDGSASDARVAAEHVHRGAAKTNPTASTNVRQPIDTAGVSTHHPGPLAALVGIIGFAIGTAGCGDIHETMSEFRQAGKEVARLWSPTSPAKAATFAPAALSLPGCMAETCASLCDQAALGKIFLTQPSNITSGEVECFTCIVNAVTLCDGRNDVGSTPLDAQIAERSLDLLMLPPAGIDGLTGAPTTSPIGRID